MAMRKSRFTEEQIAHALRQAETGTPVTEVCRAMGISEQTYYVWKKRCGGLGVYEIRPLKLLEEENRRLKQLVADLSLDKLMLQDVLQKIVRPERRRELVWYLEWTYRVSERPGCAALRFDRSSHRYRAIRNDQAMLRGRIRELPAARVRYGYFRIYILLRREGWRINHKRVHRLYRLAGLSMRLKRPRRHVTAAHRRNRPAAGAVNENWSMDFVSDALFDERRIRALTVVDDYTRKSLAIEVGQGITGEQVVAVMNRLTTMRGAPKRIRVDNGPEFVSLALDQWAYLHQVTLDFSRPGKPTDNALVESFNGRLRDECLNTNWFLSLDDARRKIEAWREHYNQSRPHTSLGYVPPSVFAQQAAGNGGP